MRPSTAAQVINCQLKIGGSYLSTETYAFAGDRPDQTGINNPFGSGPGAGYSSIPITSAVGNGGSLSANFRMFVHNPSSTAVMKAIDWTGTSQASTSTMSQISGAGFNQGTAALTGVRFLAASGNINGTFRLYGIRNS